MLLKYRTRLGREEEAGAPNCGCKTASVRSCGGTIWPRVRDQSGGERGLDATGCGERHVAERAQKQQQEPRGFRGLNPTTLISHNLTDDVI